MSVKMMTAVYESNLTKATKSVALAYADHAGDDGEHIFPCIERIAWKTGYSIRQVKRATKELNQLKILIKVGIRGKGINEYRMSAENLPKRASFKEFQKREREKKNSRGDKMSPQKKGASGDIHDNRGDIHDNSNDVWGDTMSPKSSLNNNHHTNHHLIDSTESILCEGFSPSQEKEKEPTKEKAAMRKEPPKEKKLGSDDTPEMRPIDSAFGIFQRLAEIDPSISSKRGQVLRDAKALLNGNNGRAIPAYSPQDILDCAKFVVQDPWRISNMVPLTSQVLIEKLPKWIDAKRPSTWAEWQAKAPTGKAWEEDLYEMYRDKTNDPEVKDEPLFG